MHCIFIVLYYNYVLYILHKIINDKNTFIRHNYNNYTHALTTILYSAMFIIKCIYMSMLNFLVIGAEKVPFNRRVSTIVMLFTGGIE